MLTSNIFPHPLQALNTRDPLAEYTYNYFIVYAYMVPWGLRLYNAFNDSKGTLGNMI